MVADDILVVSFRGCAMSICKSNDFVGDNIHNKNWWNWSQRVNFHADEYFEPRMPQLPFVPAPIGLMNLVHVVSRASTEGKGLRAIGSGWAFADIAKSDAWVVSLKQLNSQLLNVIGPAGAGLTPEWKAKQSDPNAPTRLVHVEAGMEVGALSENLQASGLGLPTLGGANGQTLAGALSTSTHGGDWDQPPLPDIVRAIHLVTDGGRELWIERESEPITTDANLKPLLTCRDTQIVRSDEIFDAAVVSFGRFGVIYSYVLEVRKAFRVVEVTTMPTRAAVFQALTAGMGSAAVFNPLFSLLKGTPPPAALAESGAISAAAPYFFQIIFSSLNQEDCWVQRRWITNQPADLNMAGGSTPPSCIIDLGLAAGWVIGGVDAMVLVARGAIQDRFNASLIAGKRGSHQVVTSGTREASHNFSVYADSIEVIFDAHDSSYLDFLNALEAAKRTYKQVGYISVRPSRASRAVLSMHNVASPHAISIEVAILKNQPDNESYMQFVHHEAVKRGGRPHWGQINTLNGTEMAALYGQQLKNWRVALQRVSGMSTTFSNNFTRQRDLEPLAIERKIAAVSQGTDELLVLGINNAGMQTGRGVVQYTHWSPATPWNGWQPLAPGIGSPETHLGSAVADGCAYMFRIGPDGWVYFTSRRMDGQWAIWWIAGKSNEPAWHGVPCGAVHGASCQPGMLHVFYADQVGRIIASRADLNAGTTWPETTRVRKGRTAPGGHVTAVSRRPGQLDIFTVGMDGGVYSAAWNAAEGWKGWFGLPGASAKPGTHISAVSRALDHIDLFMADALGRTMTTRWSPGAGWQPWVHLHGGITQPDGYVTAISRSAGLLDLFTVGVGSRIHTAAWAPGGWHGWWAISDAKAVGQIAGVSRSPDKLDLFFVNPESLVQSVAWEPGRNWGGPWTIG